jgi:GNAT superfamily N-acetyltransferase
MRTFKAATATDLPEISKLVNSAYRGDSSRAGWTTEADFLEGQRTDVETLGWHMEKGTILCVRENGEMIGCVFVEDVSPEGSAYLGMLTVKPVLQAAGLGREILKRAEELAHERGATKIILGVVQIREALIAWYERRGYARNGETKPFPYGNERFGQPLRSDLHFVFFEKSMPPRSSSNASDFGIL